MKEDDYDPIFNPIVGGGTYPSTPLSKEDEMIELLRKHLQETPKEELEKEWAEIEKLGIEGPTVEEYFESLNPTAMYAKGYTDSAKKFRELLIAEINFHSIPNRDEIVALIDKIYNSN